MRPLSEAPASQTGRSFLSWRPVSLCPRDSSMKNGFVALPLAALTLAPGVSAAEPTIGKSIGMKHPAFHYPPTKRMDLVEEQFGVKVADPYRWLEHDVRQDNEVRAWLAAENTMTQTYLQTLPGRNILRKRMAALLAHDRYGTPRQAGSHAFYTHKTGWQNQSPHPVSEGMSGETRLLL